MVLGVRHRVARTRGVYAATCTLGSSDGGNGYRLRGHDITETRDAADDYRSDTSTTGVVTVGGSVTGKIERTGDHDWFAVDMVAGKAYRIDLEGQWTKAGTLRDPVLRGVKDDNGVHFRNTADHNGGSGVNSRVVFTAPADATYYLAASSIALGTGTGTYKLSVTEYRRGHGGRVGHGRD